MIVVGVVVFILIIIVLWAWYRHACCKKKKKCCSKKSKDGKHGQDGLFKNMVVYDANGTFTAPACANRLLIQLWGAGGSGAGGPEESLVAGGGGGAGGFLEDIVKVCPGNQYTIVVGAGGASVGGWPPRYGHHVHGQGCHRANGFRRSRWPAHVRGWSRWNDLWWLGIKCLGIV